MYILYIQIKVTCEVNIFFCLFFYSEAFLWSAATSTDYYVRPFLCPMTVRYLSAYCSSHPCFYVHASFFLVTSAFYFLLSLFTPQIVHIPSQVLGSTLSPSHFPLLRLQLCPHLQLIFFNLLFLDLDPVCAIRPVAQPLHLPA